MGEVLLPVSGVSGGELGGMEDQENVLGIPLLGALGEVETAGDDSLAVDHHDLVVRDLVNGIDVCRHSIIGEESGRGVWEPRI